MRWIFFSVIFLNVFYFSWELWITDKKVVGHSLSKPNLIANSKNRAKIKLLSEGGIQITAFESNARPSLPDVGAIVSGNMASNNRCPVVGPFKSFEPASDFLLKLIGRGINADLSEVVLTGLHDTWVVIPPLEGRRGALRKLRELQGKGIDSYIITQGPLKNAISLGLYKRRQSAVDVQGDLKIAGYATVLEKRMRQITEYWVKINTAVGPENKENQIMGLLSEKTSLKYTQTLCE